MFRELPLLLALALGLGAALAPACKPAEHPATSARPAGSGSNGVGLTPSGPRAEDVWLAGIGTGREQTARVCARGARDRVAAVLCGESAASIRSLTDLYRALGLVEPDHRDVAATTHSLGLSARIVSALNPRTFVFVTHADSFTFERFAVVGFARGEQLVELVGIEPETLDYNFYLLRFEQRCNASRCTPSDLLTEKIESNWTGWTLYSDRELEDTALDCISCHQPFGPGTRKQLLMRQTLGPWLHWGDFRGVTEHRICPTPTSPPPGPWIPGEGLNLITEIEGPRGRHAGIPVTDLAQAKSGERFALFLTDAENAIREKAHPNDYPYAQLDFDSTAALCERLETGASPTWERQRQESLSRGLPVPYYGQDVLDAAKRREVLSDRAGFLARHANENAFDLAMSLIDMDVATAVGFIPRDEESAPQILKEMCVRCHAGNTDRRLKRARFNAEALERFEPAVARSIRARIAAAHTSPELMPPVRSGELPARAIASIDRYVRERCSEPGVGACD